MRGLWMLVLAVGCSSGGAESDVKDAGGSFSINSTEEIAELCDEGEPIAVKLAVEFPATEPDCPWDTADNLSTEQGIITARIEQTALLKLPEGVVVCGLDYDFVGPSGGEGTPMVYDDNFYFTFVDVLLATSYGPAIDLGWFSEDGGLPIYTWDDLVGRDFEHSGVASWCLGQENGSSECDIPPTETEGVMSLSFDTAVIEQLSLRAVQEGRFEFGFITTGDNDPSDDCSHDDFEFEVEVGYVRAR